LGSWDILKGFTGCGDNNDIKTHIAMQIVNESALCKNRIRKTNYIAHQGFELVNGLSFLASDEQVHLLLNEQSISQSKSMQETLLKIRYNKGHYIGKTIAVDPHRIISTTKRIMPMKKKQPIDSAKKLLQTFFAIDADTGQPFGCGIGSPGVNTTKETLKLLNSITSLNENKPLVIADKEHFTQGLIDSIHESNIIELLVPVISNENLRKIEKSLNYEYKWAGYSIAETRYSFIGSNKKYRLIVQREGELEKDYKYMSFIAISEKPAEALMTDLFVKRWSIEEFFNFEGAMGFDRASTFNLNIRYAKMSLALLAQAATYNLKSKLNKPFETWSASHLADAIFSKLDGDIRVKDDTIVVTCYNLPTEFGLQKHYQNLPVKLENEGINPHIPWLFDFKLDFRFK
jgi:hypothetical protein